MRTPVIVSALIALASLQPASPSAAASPNVVPERATKDTPFVNSLLMRFVPVPSTNILMCIHETRKSDYATFAAETPDLNGMWKRADRDGAPVSDGDDHAVVCVSWDDAKSFCAWLTEKEGRTFRLPTDREWSFAVGIGRLESGIMGKGVTPLSMSQRLPTEFPWGSTWPPPTGAGNYADTTYKQMFPAKPFFEGYTDGYSTTAPVMSFKPNKLGIFDLGGNVWEWCEDWATEAHDKRVLRGGSWFTAMRGGALSSYRNLLSPDYRDNIGGFRCVLDLTQPSRGAIGSNVPPRSPEQFPPLAPRPASAPPAPQVGPSQVIAVHPNDSLLEGLAKHAPNASAWVLAPLEQPVPADIRQNLTFLREDLIDEGKKHPQSSLEAYRIGVQLCNTMIAALDERDQKLVQAGYRAVQATTITPATNQALEARRNYLMSWPQFAREVEQRADVLRVAQGNDEKNVRIAMERLKVDWADRTSNLRKALDTLYVQFREALRQAPAKK